MSQFFDQAMRELQTPENAERLAIVVTRHLDTVRGFSVLPQALQWEISKCASELYGMGYVKGFKSGWTKGVRA